MKEIKDQQDDFIVPPYLFEEPKPRIVLNFHFVNFVTIAYVNVENIMLERPKETFLYVRMNITSPLKSQNQL